MRDERNCHDSFPTEADGKSSVVIQLKNSSITAPYLQILAQNTKETLPSVTCYLKMSLKNSMSVNWVN